jgi:hypothetical protein
VIIEGESIPAHEILKVFASAMDEQLGRVRRPGMTRVNGSGGLSIRSRREAGGVNARLRDSGLVNAEGAVATAPGENVR